MTDKAGPGGGGPDERRPDDPDRGSAHRPAADSAPGEGNGEPGSGNAQTYEQARDELIEVVRRLENGGTTLEESLQLWERGEELAGVCQAWLDGARARLDRATARAQADDDPTARSG